MKNTIIQDLKCPLHECQRNWIRKPLTILFSIVLLPIAILLALCTATLNFCSMISSYSTIAYLTYKGLKK